MNLSGWSDLQSIDEINVGRFFEYDDDAMFMFQRWFPFLLKPSVKVLEVGAGSGYFTGKLLELNPNMDLICLEPDLRFVKHLRTKYKDRIDVVESTLETPKITPSTFDVALSHIVIHNLPEPLVALQSMKDAVKERGYVVTIEPHPGSRSHYPDSEVGKALDFIAQVKVLRWNHRRENIEFPDTHNPWEYCYPHMFSEVGLTNIRSHGWNSVFTLSDPRFDLSDRRKWMRLRKMQVLGEQIRRTNELLELEKTREEIEQSYSTISDYFECIENMTNKELQDVHEQHVYPRIITIGQKMDNTSSHHH